ncbi:MAG TPA: ATP-binding protein [Gemmatimonadota bacterium]|nr:ATP-binding protein [Gemmatimonadota bacterium]
MSDSPLRRVLLQSPAVIATGYLVLGWLWIVVSDSAVETLFPGRTAELQTANGLLFVVGTALIVWALLRFHRGQERAARDAAARVERRYRALIEKSSAMVWVLEADGRIRYASPEFQRVFGRGGLDVTGACALDWLEAGDRPPARAAFLDRPARPAAPVAPVEVRLRDAGGNWRLVEARATDLRDDPAVGGVVVHMIDLTEHRRLERHLIQSEKTETVGRMAGGIAHDFNNLLTVVNGYVERVLEGMPHADPLRVDILEIRRATHRAIALVRHLLDSSRSRERAPRRLDVNDVVHDLRPMLRRVTPETVAVETTLEARFAVLFDPVELEQVLLNLVLNARDALPGGGTIRIETETVDLSSPLRLNGSEIPGGAYTVLRVADDGAGMDAETARRAFDPFFTTKPPGQGTGLGLSTVRGVVERSGGRIHLDTAPGRGVRVEIWLPIAAGLEASAR